jgi:hypothetical protein
LPSPAPTPKCPHKKNLINSLTNKFPDLQLTDNNGIPVVMFLDCSSCVLVVFDCLSASLFTPVKSDMTNNIQVWSYLNDMSAVSTSTYWHTGNN